MIVVLISLFDGVAIYTSLRMQPVRKMYINGVDNCCKLSYVYFTSVTSSRYKLVFATMQPL